MIRKYSIDSSTFLSSLTKREILENARNRFGKLDQTELSWAELEGISGGRMLSTSSHCSQLCELKNIKRITKED